MTSAARAAVALREPTTRHELVNVLAQHRACESSDDTPHGPGATRRLSEAADVVGWMAEQARNLVGSGPKELAMAEAFAAAFGYMVEYLHHVSIGRCEPCEALAKAAAGPTELTPGQLEFLCFASRNGSKPLAQVARSA